VAGVGLRAYEQTERTALIGSIAFALLFALVIARCAGFSDTRCSPSQR
jgi:hypothetical protein